MWAVLPPPYGDDDKFHTRTPMRGTYKFAVGKGSAAKTLQVLNGMPPEDAYVDLGWADIHIASKQGKLEIRFTGGKEAVKKRWAEEYAGMDAMDREAYDDLPPTPVTMKVKQKRVKLPIITQEVVDGLREAYELEGKGGDIGYSLNEVREYYKKGDKPIERVVLQEVRQDPNLVLYGARSVNMQLPKHLQTHTEDFDIVTDSKARSEAVEIEQALDKRYGGNYFKVEEAKHKGTYKVVSIVTGRTIADVTLDKSHIPYKVISGVKVATLDHQVGKIRESLSTTDNQFRHKKDLETLQRILLNKIGTNEGEDIEAPIPLSVKRGWRMADKYISGADLPTKTYLGRKLRQSSLGTGL